MSSSSFAVFFIYCLDAASLYWGALTKYMSWYHWIQLPLTGCHNMSLIITGIGNHIVMHCQGVLDRPQSLFYFVPQEISQPSRIVRGEYITYSSSQGRLATAQGEWPRPAQSWVRWTEAWAKKRSGQKKVSGQKKCLGKKRPGQKSSLGKEVAKEKRWPRQKM